MLEFNYTELGRFILAGIPLYILFACFVDTVLELYIAKRDDWKIERQEMDNVRGIRDAQARKIVVSSPLFDRKIYAEAK